jgi:hypothetical protein
MMLLEWKWLKISKVITHKNHQILVYLPFEQALSYITQSQISDHVCTLMLEPSTLFLPTSVSYKHMENQNIK